MRIFVERWLVVAVAFAVMVALVPGVSVEWSAFEYLLIAAVYGLANAILGTVLRLLAFPLIALTLGLFAIFINVAMLYVTTWLTSLTLDSFGAALVGSLLLSVISAVIELPLARHQGT